MLGMMRTDPRVDTYLDALPEEQRALLQALRQQIAALAPEATETISYGMPAAKLGDRFLLAYAGWKRHCSIYPVHDDLLAGHEEAVRGYARTKGSLHFSARQPLPDDLVEDLVRARIATIRSSGR